MERSRNILIVDDDWQVREVLHEIFLSAGYTCQVAGDGREGLAQFRATLASLKFVTREENERLLAPGDAVLPTRLRRIASYMLQSGMIARDVDAEKLRSDRIVREVKP